MPQDPATQTVTVGMIADLAGLTPRRIQQLSQEGVLPQPKAGGRYEFVRTIKALFQYYRDQGSSMSAGLAADKARQAKAEANSSELDALKKANELIYASDAEAFWNEGFAQMVRIIQKANYIPWKSREKLSAEFLTIKLPPLKE